MWVNLTLTASEGPKCLGVFCYVYISYYCIYIIIYYYDPYITQGLMFSKGLASKQRIYCRNHSKSNPKSVQHIHNRQEGKKPLQRFVRVNTRKLQRYLCNDDMSEQDMVAILLLRVYLSV